MRALAVVLVVAAASLLGTPVASLDSPPRTFTHLWADEAADEAIEASGCSVSEGVGWVVSPPGTDADCLQTVHTGGIAASTLTCPLPTHCTLYAETRADPYGAFQIHCFPLGQGGLFWPGPGGAVQCQILTAGAPPPEWTAWWSWVSTGPLFGDPLRATGGHLHTA